MEIAASGPFGLGAVNSSSTIVKDGGAAFAAALVNLGGESAPAAGFSAAFAGAPVAGSAMATTGLSLSGSLGAEAETFSLANATAVSADISGEPEGGVSLPVLSAEGEPGLLSAVPEAESAQSPGSTAADQDLPADLPVAAAPAGDAGIPDAPVSMPSTVPAEAEDLPAPAPGRGVATNIAAVAASGEPATPTTVPAALRGQATRPSALDAAGQAIDNADLTIPPAGPHPASSVPPASADTSPEPMVQQQMAAPLTQPGRAQGKADAARSGDSAASTPVKVPFESAQAGAEPAGASDGGDETFARVLQTGAAAERTTSQSNTASAPLPTAQAAAPQPAAPVGLAPPAAAFANLVSAAPVPATPIPAAPVPTADAHPVMSFRADKVAREMGVEIARRMSSGSEELVIRLDPAELGRINIRMSVNEQGQLRAVVSADAPAVVEAIRGDIAELTRALEQAGVRTDGQSFRFDRGANGDPGGQWQQRYQQKNQTDRPGDESGFADDDLAYRPMATNGRLNMMA